MTTSTHSYHEYQLVLQHENDDRYRVTIFDPRAIESHRPARTKSDRTLLLKRRDTSISFSRNDVPHEACAPLGILALMGQTHNSTH